jgi:hypothetical protein
MIYAARQFTSLGRDQKGVKGRSYRCATLSHTRFVITTSPACPLEKSPPCKASSHLSHRLCKYLSRKQQTNPISENIKVTGEKFRRDLTARGRDNRSIEAGKDIVIVSKAPWGSNLTPSTSQARRVPSRAADRFRRIARFPPFSR